MKKILIPIVLITVVACGGNKGKEGEAGKTDSTQTTLAANATAVSNPNIIDPLTYDFTKSVSPSILFQSMNAYGAQEVQIVVYPEKYLEKEKFTEEQEAKASKDAADRTVNIKFKTVPTSEYTKGTAYVVKGKLQYFAIDDKWQKSGYFELKDAELVGEAKDTKTAKFDIASISSANVYDYQDVLNSAKAWEGKNVTVVGDYKSQTVSKDSKGKSIEIRVDLFDPKNTSDEVGCVFEAEPKLAAGQQGVSINGTLKAKFSYDRPYIVNCSLK